METSEAVLRIGEKGRWKLLNAFETHEFEVKVISMKSGIFELPSIRVFANNSEVKVNTSTFLLQC